MISLNAELRQEIEKAGDVPIRLEDPENHASYILLKSEVYDRMKPFVSPATAPTDQVPDGIRRSRAAFFRDLPQLLARKRWHGRWVLYHGDDQIRVARRPDRLLRECIKRQLRSDEFYLGVIEPHDTGREEIERSFYEFDESEPAS